MYLSRMRQIPGVDGLRSQSRRPSPVVVFVHTREPPHAHQAERADRGRSFDRLNVSPSSVVARPPLRPLPYLPIVFNFDKPETKVFTETVRLLAGLSHFVIADVTNPKSAPLELQATVPEMMIPFLPIIEEDETVRDADGLVDQAPRLDVPAPPLFFPSRRACRRPETRRSSGLRRSV